MRSGASGEHVKALQEKLAAAGFNPGPVDGEFGPQTEAAVRAFQQAKGLEVDGVVGAQTWGALGEKYAEGGPAAGFPQVTPDANLANLSPAELARLGREDKAAFFAALRPAALECERIYGVPAAITLAQAALETGWAKSLAAPYNLFGIKGTGPAGTQEVSTQEWENGRYITIRAKFRAYHNFMEGVVDHGRLFHNGYYDKAMRNYAANKSVEGFARDITGVYATDPKYADKLMSIIRSYNL